MPVVSQILLQPIALRFRDRFIRLSLMVILDLQCQIVLHQISIRLTRYSASWRHCDVLDCALECDGPASHSKVTGSAKFYYIHGVSFLCSRLTVILNE